MAAYAQESPVPVRQEIHWATQPIQLLRSLINFMLRNKVSCHCLLLCLGFVCFRTVILFFVFPYKCNFVLSVAILLTWFFIRTETLDFAYVILIIHVNICLWAVSLIILLFLTAQYHKLRANYSSVR
jgi:hypothetical protein